LNGNLVLSKVGEGVFIVRGEKEPFEAKILRPAGAKSAPPASVPDRPAHSLVKLGQHRSVRRTARCNRICTGQSGESEGGAGEQAGGAGFYAGPGPEPPPERQTGRGSVPVPDRAVQRPAHRGPRQGGRLLRWTVTGTPTRTGFRLGPVAVPGWPAQGVAQPATNTGSGKTISKIDLSSC
jgi:hypothetical protein